MNGKNETTKEKKPYYDEMKAVAKQIGLSAWVQWYHKPYECDWKEAYNKALDRRWKVLER